MMNFSRLSLQIGSLIEYSELSRLSSYTYASLKKYLNFLEKTYVCRFVKPFYRNKRTEIVKNPKVYFIDTGIRNSIVNDFRKLDERGDKGALLENGIAEQLIKQGLEFNFWRDKKKNEIDFIVSFGDGKTAAIESKSYVKTKLEPSAKAFQRAYPQVPLWTSYQEVRDDLKKDEGLCPVYLI